ncbi:MAG: pyridoxal-phosphate dependent enzyme, partial [Rikenellaceae bacterium]
IISQQPDIDIFVSGVGTGGTLSGIGRALKEYNSKIEVVAVEPADSAVISGEKASPHKLQGIGAGFIPENLNLEIIDSIIKVTSNDAFEASRNVAKKEGLLVGISSGAALHAASILSKEHKNRDKKIVVIMPDSAERYLSTELFC